MRVIRHMMTHSDQKPFLCPDCGLAFKQLAQLKNHEVVHKMPDDVSHICTLSCVIITSIGFKMPLWAKVKKCTKCDRFFANSKSLKSHVKTVHEKIRPFICNICGHKSSRKAMLEVSTFSSNLKHTPTVNFSCTCVNTRPQNRTSATIVPSERAIPTVYESTQCDI